MELKCPEKIDRDEWRKFMHAAAEDDERLQQQMTQAEKLLLDAAVPRGIYRVMPREEVPAEGISIRKHLEGCSLVAIMALTIGAGIDQLISRTQLTNMSMAVLLDTGASVLMEQVADMAEAVMKEELARKLPGMFSTSRFSPGYGDYPLHCQQEVLRYVDASRRIGVTLTSADMMVPHKSVSALVGLSEHPVTGRLAPCSECVLRGKCTFLKEGTHC